MALQQIDAAEAQLQPEAQAAPAEAQLQPGAQAAAIGLVDSAPLKIALQQLQQLALPPHVPVPALLQPASTPVVIHDAADEVEAAGRKLGAARCLADILPLWAVPSEIYMSPEVTVCL